MKVLATQVQISRSLSWRSVRPFNTRPLLTALFALMGIVHAPAIALAQAVATETSPATSPAPNPASTPTTTAVAGSATTSTAAALPSAEVREKARTAYFAGKAAYAAGNFTEAESHFTFANSLISAIQAQYWLALSLHEQGKSAEALGALALVLAHPNRGKLRGEQLKDAAARHAQLKTTPADVLLTTDPVGATITVNGQVVTTPTPTALRLGPGKHEFSVKLSGYETQRFLLTAAPGAKLTPPPIKLVPAVPPQTSTAPGVAAPTSTAPSLSAPAPILPTSADTYGNQSQSLIPAYVTLGIAGASGIVGTIFGLRALKEKKDFNDSPSREAADDTERNALIADMAFGVTLTLGITGAVLLLTGTSRQDLSSANRASGDLASTNGSLQILPYATPHSAGAAAFYSF